MNHQNMNHAPMLFPTILVLSFFGAMAFIGWSRLGVLLQEGQQLKAVFSLISAVIGTGMVLVNCWGIYRRVGAALLSTLFFGALLFFFSKKIWAGPQMK